MTEQPHMTAAEYQEMLRRDKLGLLPAVKPTHPTGKRCEVDGIAFDSLTERDRYLWLKDQPEVEYVDVHPAFTLPGGVRFTADFLVYTDGGTWAEDVKGRRPGTDFNRTWKTFNFHHALAPLIVVRRKGKGWKEHREPPRKRDW